MPKQNRCAPRSEGNIGLRSPPWIGLWGSKGVWGFRGLGFRGLGLKGEGV